MTEGKRGGSGGGDRRGTRRRRLERSGGRGFKT